MKKISEFLASLAGRIVLAVLVLVLVAVALNRCDAARQAQRKAKLSEAKGDAATRSAAGAIGTIGVVGERAQASDELTRGNADEIRNAPGAAAPVDPGVRAAGLDGLCKRAAYRDTEQCLRRADPAGMAGAGAGRADPAR